MSRREPLTLPVSGLVASKYELVGLIGRGGMGSVWEGRHVSLGTRVAIKFIDPEYADSAEARARFDNEARAAASLQSKYAIQIFDHGVTENGRPYIVMEMLLGEPLDKRLDRVGRMSIQDTARIIAQVCRALSRAHERNIIHRDLKPENIFLVHSQEDDDEIAKVLDFGIAKFRGTPGEQGVSSSTKTGAVLGTPYYMSPEQARGLRNVDHRTDIWSLGVIAHRCVTGVLPFEGESVGDLLVKICVAPLPIPSRLVRDLPPAFDAWFARALDRDPDARFSTALELADGLAFIAGISVRRGGAQSAPSPNSPNSFGAPRQGSRPPPGAIYPSNHGASGSAGSGPYTAQSGQTASAPGYYGPGHTSAPVIAATQAIPKSRAPLVAVSAVALVALIGGASVVVALNIGSKSARTNGAGTITSQSAQAIPIGPSASSVEAIAPIDPIASSSTGSVGARPAAPSTSGAATTKPSAPSVKPQPRPAAPNVPDKPIAPAPQPQPKPAAPVTGPGF